MFELKNVKISSKLVKSDKAHEKNPRRWIDLGLKDPDLLFDCCPRKGSLSFDLTLLIKRR